MFRRTVVLVSFFALGIGLFGGCAHKKKGPEPLTRDLLQSRKVALAEISGAGPESKSHVEVAIINEILDAGRFEIVDRATVQEAQETYPSESDWQGLGRKVGADYVLGVRLVDFKVKERKGYDKVVEADSLLTQESGETDEVKGTRYEKVKSFEGTVKLQCSFLDVAHNTYTYKNIAETTDTMNSRDFKENKTSMPGKMQLLEALTRQAITKFFDAIPKS